MFTQNLAKYWDQVISLNAVLKIRSAQITSSWIDLLVLDWLNISHWLFKNILHPFFIVLLKFLQLLFKQLRPKIMPLCVCLKNQLISAADYLSHDDGSFCWMFCRIKSVLLPWMQYSRQILENCCQSWCCFLTRLVIRIFFNATTISFTRPAWFFCTTHTLSMASSTVVENSANHLSDGVHHTRIRFVAFFLLQNCQFSIWSVLCPAQVQLLVLDICAQFVTLLPFFPPLPHLPTPLDMPTTPLVGQSDTQLPAAAPSRREDW